MVFVTSAFGGKGLTHYFYQSEALRRELEARGLRQALCHGCMINLVLGLSEEVKGRFAPFAARLRSPDVLTVGIQMRMGDAAMTGDSALSAQHKADIAWQNDDGRLLQHANSFLQCAQQLVDLHSTRPQQRVLYFVVSDSARLRGLLTRHLSANLSLLIIPSDGEFRVGHTDSGDKSLYHQASALRKEEVSRYLQVAAGEQWLLAWCDYLVIDHTASGFGRSAALRSLRVGRAWDGRQHRRCDGDTGALTVKEWELIGHKY